MELLVRLPVRLIAALWGGVEAGWAAWLEVKEDQAEAETWPAWLPGYPPPPPLPLAQFAPRPAIPPGPPPVAAFAPLSAGEALAVRDRPEAQLPGGRSILSALASIKGKSLV